MEILGVDINFRSFIKSISEGAIVETKKTAKKVRKHARRNVKTSMKHIESIEIPEAIRVRMKDIGTFATKSAGQLMATAGITRATAYEVRMSDEGWMIAEAGSGLPVRCFARKADAVKEAKTLARSRGLPLFIMDKHGELVGTYR